MRYPPCYTCSPSLSGIRKVWDYLCFHVMWWVNHLYVRLWFRLKIVGDENIPLTGPALLVSNHVGWLDGLILSAVSRRRISFMIAREYTSLRGLRFITRYLECIPVNRDGEDLSALKNTLRSLSAGALVACFPEGGLTIETGKGNAKAGMGLIAARSGVPVIPIHLNPYPLRSMISSLIFTKNIAIIIGEPMLFQGDEFRNREGIEKATQLIWDRVCQLGGEEELVPHP